jgi:hypothetical protein
LQNVGDGSQPFDLGAALRPVEKPRQNRRRFQNAPPPQFTDQWQVMGRDFADVEGLDVLSLSQMTEQTEETSQINGVFCQAASAKNPHGHCEGRPL